jgi:hypothetical protein
MDTLLGIKYWAVGAAAVAAFVGSFVWYMAFGRELAKVSAAFAAALEDGPQPWKMLVVLAESLVLAWVLAYLSVHLGVNGLLAGVGLGVLLWFGLSAMQWASSIVWENVPLRLAAIHAGDWLLKLVVIGAILGAWR